jgi:hypothetical protein
MVLRRIAEYYSLRLRYCSTLFAIIYYLCLNKFLLLFLRKMTTSRAVLIQAADKELYWTADASGKITLENRHEPNQEWLLRNFSIDRVAIINLNIGGDKLLTLQYQRPTKAAPPVPAKSLGISLQPFVQGQKLTTTESQQFLIKRGASVNPVTIVSSLEPTHKIIAEHAPSAGNSVIITSANSNLEQQLWNIVPLNP